MSAVCVCVLLDPSGSLEMFESYLRVASEEADDESSDHDSDMDTEETDDGESEGNDDGESKGNDDGESEGTDDGESQESESGATSSEKDDELVEERDAGTEPWWIEEEEQEEEEGDDLESADEDDESSATDDQAIPAAQPVGRRRRNATGRGTGPPKNQDFPAAPPQSLSADQKREWTFRRDRKRQHFPLKDHHLTITIKTRCSADPGHHYGEHGPQQQDPRQSRRTRSLELHDPRPRLDRELPKRQHPYDLPGCCGQVCHSYLTNPSPLFSHFIEPC